MAKQPAIIQEMQTTTDKQNMSTLDESLLSFEKMDRSSPELWPERIPGISTYSANLPPDPYLPAWRHNLTNEDINFMHQLGSMTPNSIIQEVKALHDLAYQLGVEEGKEMTRGTYLNIFPNKSKR